MKRIIATLLLIFISSLILNNFFAGFNRAKSFTILNKTSTNKDTLTIKDSLNQTLNTNKDTLLSKIDTLKVSKPNKKHTNHRATWYRTNGTRVHRNYPTAAYNYAPIGTKIRVINNLNGDTTVVEVTDRMGKGSKNMIDLSHMAFGEISKHGYGIIPVTIEIMD